MKKNKQKKQQGPSFQPRKDGLGGHTSFIGRKEGIQTQPETIDGWLTAPESTLVLEPEYQNHLSSLARVCHRRQVCCHELVLLRNFQITLPYDHIWNSTTLDKWADHPALVFTER